MLGEAVTCSRSRHDLEAPQGADRPPRRYDDRHLIRSTMARRTTARDCTREDISCKWLVRSVLHVGIAARAHREHARHAIMPSAPAGDRERELRVGRRPAHPGLDDGTSGAAVRLTRVGEVHRARIAPSDLTRKGEGVFFVVHSSWCRSQYHRSPIGCWPSRRAYSPGESATHASWLSSCSQLGRAQRGGRRRAELSRCRPERRTRDRP